MSKIDYTAKERENIAKCTTISLLIWDSAGDSDFYTVKFSEKDKKVIQNLLLTRSRYMSPLEMERFDHWKLNWFTDVYPPHVVLEFAPSHLRFYLGYDIVSESMLKNSKDMEGIELIMDDQAYRQLKNIVDAYTTPEAKKILED